MDELMKDSEKHTALVDLRNDTLDQLPQSVLRPTYDRAALTPGIVHIGLGNFHRAHQAWYLHRLMQQGKALDWAIIGAGVRADDAVMRDKLLAQDCLTTLIELDPAGKSVEITGAMIDFLPVEPDNKTLIEQMSKPEIRIVSLTVTEGGYFMGAAPGSFDLEHPDIQHDIANPTRPRTAFGAIVAALSNRRDMGNTAFTAMSCDNLLGNGAILENAVVTLARQSDPELADWISTNSAFPNSMVDCIVPATGPTEFDLVLGNGIDDAAPVTHENFRQWVIEDNFADGRPPWDTVGVTMSKDVGKYETVKLRILNGGHQVIADAAEILGIETIADAMRDPSIAGFLRKVVRNDIAPHVPSVGDMKPLEYLDLITQRFSNPQIKDTTRRVAFDGSSRHPGFIVPSIRDALDAGASFEGLALTSALWARYCNGTREDGSTVAPNDPDWDALKLAALTARETPQVWLEQRDIYGDLAKHSGFAEAFGRWLNEIYSNGTKAALARYLAA